MANLTLRDARGLVQKALAASGCNQTNAAAQTRAVIGAELDGIVSHGMAYVPIYCEHVLCGKVDGKAAPKVEALSASAFVCDARDGFAFPAIDVAFEQLIPAAHEHAFAAVGIRNSYNCGVLGQHVTALARAGLVGLGFTNAPASIAPAGGRTPVVGTNPMACAVPDGKGGAALAIDQSSSVIARSEVTRHAKRGDPIPLGWALDADGEPTTDAAVGLKGSMAPSGGYKGFGTGLMVEIFAAALTGATLGIHATSFATNDGGPPRTGQFFIAADPVAFSSGGFAARIADLTGAIEDQDGARLPGANRKAAHARVERDGIDLSDELLERIQGYAK